MKVYEVVDEFPGFPGGELAYMTYIGINFHKTKEDMQSTFLLRFVIDRKGIVKGVRVYKKKKNEYTDEEKELIKVFESMPPWIPGKCHGKKVNMLLTRRIEIRWQY